MNFEQVLQDIKGLEGKMLQSIKPGAEITIKKVDTANLRIELETASGRPRSRPLNELRRIWNELQSRPAVHVDSVLSGSGSSRNQPETILANLPYIEWLKVGNRKHIVYVGRATHQPGTLREMDGVQAAHQRRVLEEYRLVHTSGLDASVLIVTENVRVTTDLLSNVSGQQPRAVVQGTYVIETPHTMILITVAKNVEPLSIGTYPIIQRRDWGDSKGKFQVAGHTLYVVGKPPVQCLVEADPEVS